MGHLWLIGMMGTGKTTVGVISAERTGRPFLDVDATIMEASGRTIPELFAEGEDVFRRWETDMVREASAHQPSVIATGGGAILATTNVKTMRSTGTIVLLTAPVDVIAERIDLRGDRPLATSQEALAALAELRLATYLEASDHAVATEGRFPADIADEVVSCAGI